MTFKRIEGETVVLSQKGVFKQVDLFSWDGKLFAAHSGGFIRLKADGSTSRDGVQVHTLMFDGALFKDRFGRLCVSSGEDRTAIENAALLIGRD